MEITLAGPSILSIFVEVERLVRHLNGATAKPTEDRSLATWSQNNSKVVSYVDLELN